MLTRFSLILTALFAFLPYVSTTKQPPIPSFWAEWIAAAIACGWLLSLRHRVQPVGAPSHGSIGRAASSRAATPVAILAFAALGAVVLLQLLTRLPMFRGAPLLVLPALVLASLVCMAAARLRAEGEASRLADVWSMALVAAFTLNFVMVVFERQGLHLYVYQLGFRPFNGRAEGFIGQPNQLAVFAAISSVAVHYLWMRRKLPAWCHLLLAAMAAFVIAATGSRAGLLLWFVGAALGALALRDSPLRKTGWRLLLMAAALTIAAQFVLPWMDTGGAAVAVARGEGRGRIELWRDSWALIRLHPLVGVGYGNFMAARWTELSTSLLEPNANQAHNLIAQLAVELGVPGAALVLIPLALALWRCVRAVSHRGVAPEQFLAGSVALLVAGYAMVEFPLWYMFFLLPFAMMLGLVDETPLAVPISSSTPGARWIGWGVAASLLGLLAVDYDRSEQLYTSLELQQRLGHGALVRIPLKEATEVGNLSAFDVYANLMYARTLSPDGLFMGYKLDIADRAMLSMTNEETVGRKIAFLVAAHEDEAALQLLAQTRRSPHLESTTRGVLNSLAPTNPSLATFVSGLPPLRAVTMGNNPPSPQP